MQSSQTGYKFILEHVNSIPVKDRISNSKYVRCGDASEENRIRSCRGQFDPNLGLRPDGKDYQLGATE